MKPLFCNSGILRTVQYMYSKSLQSTRHSVCMCVLSLYLDYTKLSLTLYAPVIIICTSAKYIFVLTGPGIFNFICCTSHIHHTHIFQIIFRKILCKYYYLCLQYSTAFFYMYIWRLYNTKLQRCRAAYYL